MYYYYLNSNHLLLEKLNTEKVTKCLLKILQHQA